MPSISAADTRSPEGQTEIKSRYGRKGEIQVNTRTLIVSTKTITITEEAYERLRSRKGENQSFSYSSSRISPQVKALPDPCLNRQR
jgi:hypothetical protein